MPGCENKTHAVCTQAMPPWHARLQASSFSEAERCARPSVCLPPDTASSHSASSDDTNACHAGMCTEHTMRVYETVCARGIWSSCELMRHGRCVGARGRHTAAVQGMAARLQGRLRAAAGRARQRDGCAGAGERVCVALPGSQALPVIQATLAYPGTMFGLLARRAK